VPAYNEARRLPKLLATLARQGDVIAASAGMSLAEVIVVDDGSSDGTATLVDPAALGGRVRLVRLGRNHGKGAAVRTGVLAARAERVLVSDTDLSAPLEQLPLLAGPLDAGADIAMGSRGLPESRVVVHQPRYRELMGNSFNWALRLLLRLPYRDTQCGFKLFRLESTRVLFEQQRLEGFAYDVELCLLAREHGLRVVEVPIEWWNSEDTRVPLLGGSARMGIDLLRLTARAWRS
jgi:dolichyl-phosphate beta-glucosyltransferase